MLHRNRRWISYRDNSENLQAVKNEDLALNTFRWDLYAEMNLSENGWMIIEENVQPVCFIGKGSSSDFVSNLKPIWVNWSTAIPLKSSKTIGFRSFKGSRNYFFRKICYFEHFLLGKNYTLLRWLFSMQIERSMYIYQVHICLIIYMPFS